MLSITGYKVRIVEAFYNEDKLFVRSLPYITISRQKPKGIDLCLRWLLSSPLDIRTVTLREPELGISSNNRSQDQLTPIKKTVGRSPSQERSHMTPMAPVTPLRANEFIEDWE